MVHSGSPHLSANTSFNVKQLTSTFPGGQTSTGQVASSYDGLPVTEVYSEKPACIPLDGSDKTPIVPEYEIIA